MANQAKVLPLGKLDDVPTMIGDKQFLLTYIVIDPSTPSNFPLLLGRPWLYGAKTKMNWYRKTITFGKPPTTIPWGKGKYQGETSTTDEGYTSDMEEEEDVLHGEVKTPYKKRKSVTWVDIIKDTNESDWEEVSVYNIEDKELQEEIETQEPEEGNIEPMEYNINWLYWGHDAETNSDQGKSVDCFYAESA